MRTFLTLAMLVATAGLLPANAQAKLPDLTGKWVCDPAEILIRDQWSTLKYTIEISEQRGPLMKAQIDWGLPTEEDVKGEQGDASSFSGKVKALGRINWGDTSIELVAFGDTHRHHGQLVDADTIKLQSSEAGADAWVSRTTCRRTR